jgi:hypothetical protein
VNERIYPRSANPRKSPRAERGYQGLLPPALEPLRPFCVEHDAVIVSILKAQSAIKAAIAALEHEHEQLSD